MTAVLIKRQKYDIFVKTAIMVTVLIKTKKYIFARTAIIIMITVLIKTKKRQFCEDCDRGRNPNKMAAIVVAILIKWLRS